MNNHYIKNKDYETIKNKPTKLKRQQQIRSFIKDTESFVLLKCHLAQIARSGSLQLFLKGAAWKMPTKNTR